jgi:UDP-N-acetylglucosamine--N-acetylmuramyl-(pentapeptide) pyrophosphoryl-undecaprenol N-acetylglucosamine transferase
MGARVMVMAGGTGGHVFPALAVAERLRERGAEVFWLGTRQGLEARVVPAAGIEMEWIDVHGLRGKGALGWVLAPFGLGRALAQAAGILRRRRPDVAMGLGGFASGPGGLAARLMGIPLVIHEQNAVPGLTNRWLARWASRVLEAFPGSFPARRRARETGNPVRAAIATLAAPAQRLADRSGPPRLLVLGGSLGAQALNEILPQALSRLTSGQRPLVRHQAGRGKAEVTEAQYRADGVEAEVCEFLDDMAAAYGWADLVVCRAGALTIAELAAAGVGAILVPYPHAADDHQSANARFLSSVGAAEQIPQSELTPQRLAERLSAMLADRPRLLAMAEAARAKARPAASETVAEACLELCP